MAQDKQSKSVREIADEIFETQSADESVRYGQVLRHVREALGISLEEVSAEQKISVTYLMAIERMEVGPIPGGYLTGYLRNYANILGLPADKVVKEYTAACGATQTVIEAKPVPKIGELNLKPDRRPLYIAGTAAVVAAALILAVFVVKPTGANGNKSTNTSIVLETGRRNSLFSEATRKLPDHARTLPLELVAIKQAWLEVRAADGTIFRSRVMSKGETYFPRLDAGWTVSARDGSAFLWRVGDIEVGLLGEEAETPVFSESVDGVLAMASALSSPDLAANDANSIQP